jgi:hypothetical protein
VEAKQEAKRSGEKDEIPRALKKGFFMYVSVNYWRS